MPTIAEEPPNPPRAEQSQAEQRTSERHTAERRTAEQRTAEQRTAEPHQHRQIAESFGIDAERYDRTRPRYPDALIDGKPATVDEAVEAAADILHRADMPLVYGLSNVTCETQREAVALADQIGAVVDSHTSL